MLSLKSRERKGERESERERDGMKMKRAGLSSPFFSCALNESHLEMRVLSVGEDAWQLWGAAGYQALPAAWQARKKERQREKEREDQA